jgi:hypothetical protein
MRCVGSSTSHRHLGAAELGQSSLWAEVGFAVNWYDAACEYDKRTDAQNGSLTSLPTEWQRELVALMLVNRDVNNGAYLQFLANNGRETYVYASRALRTIGAHSMADIIDRCQALVDEHFPSDGKSSEELSQLLPNPIIDCKGRRIKDAGSVLPEPIVRRIYELSYEFMDYYDNVDELADRHYRTLIEGDDLGSHRR